MITNPSKIMKEALTDLCTFLQDKLNSSDYKENKKCALISYWIKDFLKFMNMESTCAGHIWKKYKRGDIIKVHLGFRIGNEEGGLHYAVVIDNDNNIRSGVLTIIPLTSVKSSTNLDKLGKDRIFLGTELYNLLSLKVNTQISALKKQLAITKAMQSPQDKELSALESLLKQTLKTQAELLKLKSGSIALIGQITTVSKIRIYDPLSTSNTLHGIKLSAEKLNLIDDAIKQLYTKI